VLAHANDAFEARHALLQRCGQVLFNQRVEPIGTTELLPEIGVPRSYARALPAMLRTFPPPLRAKVLFRSNMS
jgi:hypothetical protein